MSAIQPSKASLLECSIGGVNFIRNVGGSVVSMFHVQELRIYEDNCKFYFTGQLIIEAEQNTFEAYLIPKARVVISFISPPNNRIYTERFRVYSYESKPREGDIENSMIVTISLMGDEYFKDKESEVQKNYANMPATAAAAQIHSQYIGTNGGLKVPQQSIGMIGLEKHPHQVISKSPSKAIHDLLDKAIFPVSHFGPGIYYRDKPGYMIAAIEYLIHSQPITGNFVHQPDGGEDLAVTLQGYNRIINFRPVNPPGEDRGGTRGGEAQGLGKALGFMDLAAGNSDVGKGGTTGVIKNVIDKFRQLPNIDKHGPGGFKARENAFITKLTFSPKYWVSVPLQTGINVTVGNRIKVTYPFGGRSIIQKTLWVARLIHELRFTEGKDRSIVTVNGTTDMFGLFFTG